MSTRKLLAILIAILVAVSFAACERKVTVEEVADDDGNGNGEPVSCFGCHSDQEYDLMYAQNQWAVSLHGIGETVERNRLNAGFYQACEQCHSHEGFLTQNTSFTHDGTQFSKIQCFTCHAPHTNGDFRLRVETAVTLADGATEYDRGESNICVACHQSRANVATTVVDNTELSEHYGPHHSNQSDMLLGENAYEYDGYSYNQNSAHTNVVQDGCLGCHFKGSQDEFVGGHTFAMHHEEEDVFNVGGCNQSTCHGEGTFEDFDVMADADFDWDGEVEGVQHEVEGLMDSLQVLLIDAGLLADYSDAGEPAVWEPAEVTVSTADSAGAVFNWVFVHEDQSEGIHNTKYAVALLQSSINFMDSGDPNGVSRRTMPMLASH